MVRTDRGAITDAAGSRLSADWTSLASSHPAGRFLDTLLHILKGHAWSQRDFDVRALKEGLTNHRNFRRVRQVEDRKECALSVLNEAVDSSSAVLSQLRIPFGP
jgi:hypothetical protein